MFRLLERYYNSPSHKYINSPQLEEDLMEAAKMITIEQAIKRYRVGILCRDLTRRVRKNARNNKTI